MINKNKMTALLSSLMFFSNLLIWGTKNNTLDTNQTQYPLHLETTNAEISIANKGNEPLIIEWISKLGSPPAGIRGIIIKPHQFRTLSTQAQFKFEKSNEQKFVKTTLERILIRAQNKKQAQVNLKGDNNTITINSNAEAITAQQAYHNDPEKFFTRLKLEAQSRQSTKKITIHNKSSQPILIGLQKTNPLATEIAKTFHYGTIIKPNLSQEIKLGPYWHWKDEENDSFVLETYANTLIITTATGKTTYFSLLPNETSLTLSSGKGGAIIATDD